MSELNDHKLDTLLTRLKEPPPPGALERAWEEIDSRLTWRLTMVIHSMLERSGLVRLGPMLAAASVMVVAYVVGVMVSSESPLTPTMRAFQSQFGLLCKSEMEDSPYAIPSGSGAPCAPESGFGDSGPIHPDLNNTMAVLSPYKEEKEKQSWSDGGKYADGRSNRPAESPMHDAEVDWNREEKRGAIELGGQAEVDLTRTPDKTIAGDPSAVSAEDAYRQAQARLFTRGPETTVASDDAEISKPGEGGGGRPASRTTPTSGPRPLGEPGKRPRETSETEAPATPRPLQKIIKTAELTLEVTAFAPASRAVDDLVTRFQGFYANSRVEQHEDNTTSAVIVIRVPQENFEALFGALKRLGEVKAENARGEDVTAQYADVDARIRNAQHLEARLLALLEEKKRSDKMSEILEVEREIARVRQEVEQYQGQMRVMQDRIRFGTIHLTLAEPRRSIPQGTLAIEAKSVPAAEAALDQLVASLHGEVADRHTTKRADGTLALAATVRVPLPAFGRLTQGLQALGRVASQTVEGFNVAVRAEDPGAKDVMASVAVSIAESVSQLPAGTARLEVRTLSDAAAVIGGLLRQFEGVIRSRQEQRVGGGANATYVLAFPRRHYAAAAAALPTIGRVDDKQFQGVDVTSIEGGAAEVPCEMTLVLFERSRQEPSALAQVSAPDLDAVASRIQALLKTVDGQVQSHVEQRTPGGESSANYALRCRRSQFAALVAGIDSVGRVTNKQVQGLDLEPVTGAAADVLCTLQLVVSERRAPVPAAQFVLVVQDATAAARALKTLRDAHGAETVGMYTNQKADGATDQDWRFQVAVDQFDVFIAGVAELGRVRVKQVRDVGSATEEKPDPKALADVAVTLTQRSPFAPPEEETSGSIREAVRAAWKHFYASIALILYGLVVIAPWLAILLAIHVGAKRLRRMNGKKNATETPAVPAEKE